MSTAVHSHLTDRDYEGNTYISGVYYVQVPEKSGHLVFIYPYNSHVHTQIFCDASSRGVLSIPFTHRALRYAQFK